MLRLTHFLPMKKIDPYSLYINLIGTNQKRYDDLALSLLYRNVPQKVLRLYNNDGDFRGILSPRAKALQ